MRTLAIVYGCSIKVTRDCSDADVRRTYPTVSKKAHSDHGGNVEETDDNETTRTDAHAPTLQS